MDGASLRQTCLRSVTRCACRCGSRGANFACHVLLLDNWIIFLCPAHEGSNWCESCRIFRRTSAMLETECGHIGTFVLTRCQRVLRGAFPFSAFASRHWRSGAGWENSTCGVTDGMRSPGKLCVEQALHMKPRSPENFTDVDDGLMSQEVGSVPRSMTMNLDFPSCLRVCFFEPLLPYTATPLQDERMIRSSR